MTIKKNSPWLKHGFWNVLEHGLIRLTDSLVSMTLLWVLVPESFAKVALAQAWVAPMLFLFVSPETVIYRDFSLWKSQGPASMSANLRALRLFSWGKALAAIVIAGLSAYVFPVGDGFNQRFYLIMWAFSLALAPQLSGADREFLRLDLKLQRLTAVTFCHKFTLLAGTVFVAFQYRNRMDLLAGVAIFSTLLSTLIAHIWARASLRELGASATDLKTSHTNSFRVISEGLKSFSIWGHFSGVIFNWVLSMDLFMLGMVGIEARQLGIYASVLKLANFSFALPVALANLFSIWVGRQTAHAEESRQVRILSARLFFGSLLQALVIAVLGPFLISFLSRGRWSEFEQKQMVHWLYWILAGSVIISSTFLATSWLALRGKLIALVYRVYIPWGVISLILYTGAIQLTHGSRPMAAAVTNVAIALVFVVLLAVFLKTSREKA